MKNGRFKVAKGFVMGVLFTLLLSGTVLMASAEMRQVVFGVGVSFNGQAVQFDADSQPFIMEGRTFLPVRAIADIAGLEVDFDGATNTVLLTSGGGAAAQPAATRLASTLFNYSVRTAGANNWVRSADSVNMFGATHANGVVQFSAFGTVDLTSEYNLGRNYSRLTGTFGSVDGFHLTGVAVAVYGDGNLLLEFAMTDIDAPRPIDIDVTGIQLLRIEMSPEGRGGPGGTTGSWALSADLIQ